MTRREASVVVDEVSRSIIEQLQEDGRRPYATIGKAVGLSEAAVRQRIQRLTEAGVMQIVAVADPAALGFSRSAMVGITVHGDIEKVADALEAMPEIDYLVVCAGSYDILAELVVTDDEELLDLINGRIRAVEGVHSTQTFIYLKLRKQIYTWGTR